MKSGGKMMMILMLTGSCLLSALISTGGAHAAPTASEYGHGLVGIVGTGGGGSSRSNNQRGGGGDFRSRRGFKTVGLATARGFGKRSSSLMHSQHQHIGQQQQQHQMEEEQEEQQQPLMFYTESNVNHNVNDDEESFPVEWLVNYLQKKPTAIRYLVQHLLDHNDDGQVTSSEIVSSLSAVATGGDGLTSSASVGQQHDDETSIDQ